MVATPSPRPVRAGRTSFRRRAAALAAAALLASSCTSSHHPRARASTSTTGPMVGPVAAPTTTPAPQYAPAPYTWARATSPALAVAGGPTATISAVVAPELSGDWMMFGSRSDATGTPAPTIWTSADGLRWGSAELGPSGPGQALAAAQYRTTTVAVGSTGRADGQQAAVWLSAGAGQPFLPESVPPSNGPSTMRLVAAGALGLFSVGSVDGRLAIWSSTSGRQWAELSGAEKLISASPGARVNALIAEGDVVYAAGTVLAGTTLQAALWATGDGIDWHVVTSAGSAFSGPGGRAIYSLAPLGTGLVAVGALDEGFGWVPASWISPDGQSWSLPSVDFPGVGHPTPTPASLGASDGTAVRAVAAIPTLAGPTPVVAAGGGPDGQRAWRSTDGLHWTSVALPPTAAAATSWRPELIGATQGTVVIADAEPGQPYVLTATATATAAGPASAVGAPVWAQPSSDPTVFGPVRATAVPVWLRLLAGQLHLLVQLVRRPQVIGPASVSTVSLASSDGTTWTASTGAAPAGDPAMLPAAGALSAHLPSGWVAASGGPPGAAMTVWGSPTGSTWKKVAQLTVPAGSAADGSGSSGTGSAPPGGTDTGGPTGSVALAAITLNGVCTARLGPAAGAGGVGATGAGRYVFDFVGSASTAAPPAPSPSPGVTAFSVTRSAAAWSSPSGAAWRDTAVAPPSPVGQAASMSGCVSAGADLAAFGTAPSPAGLPQPAVWRSADGAAWSRVASAAFGSDPSAPLLSLAAHGQDWVAVGNPDPYADPTEEAAAGGRGPAAATGQDGAVGPTTSVEGGQDVLWASVDRGGSWQVLDTATAPWLGDQTAQLDLVGYAPAGGTTAGGVPVVVGSVDGQLGVWTGTPVPGVAAGG